MKLRSLFVPVLIALSLLACNQTAPNLDRGFSLPKGDAKNGEAVFSNLQCTACHVLAGSEDDASGSAIRIPLDPKSKTYTYEFLVTSIINPSHQIATGFPPKSIAYQGKSKMRRYNDFMTVTELVDLVEYLHIELDISVPNATVYPDLSIPIKSNST